MVVCLGTIYRITDPEIETFKRLEYLSSPKQITTLRGHIFVFILLMTSIFWIVQKSLKSTSVFLETMPALSAWATTTRHDASLVLRPPSVPYLLLCTRFALKYTPTNLPSDRQPVTSYILLAAIKQPCILAVYVKVFSVRIWIWNLFLRHLGSSLISTAMPIKCGVQTRGSPWRHTSLLFCVIYFNWPYSFRLVHNMCHFTYLILFHFRST